MVGGSKNSVPRVYISIYQGGLQSAIFHNFRNFPQFQQFFFFFGNLKPGEYLIPQFSEGVQNHNMWFNFHMCLEYPFLSKFVKVDHNVWNRIFCWLLALFGLVSFWRGFPCPLSRKPKFSKSQPQFPFPKSAISHNFSAIPHFMQFFRSLFWGGRKP